ncbi:MAG: VWA domain-containing protein [Bacteroidales bacterium]|nr:VWA domain-containing protein [Bacteroidales bacterium]
MRRLSRLLVLFLLAITASGAFAQQPGAEKTRLLVILDCSNSMWDRWQSDAKIKVTQTVLLKFLDSVARQQNIEVALRVFGHLNKDAFGTKLEVPFGSNNYYKLSSKIKTLVPRGGCTMATALTKSLNDFPATGSSRNLLLVITDGIDDRDGNICAVARQVQLSGVVVQTFILGIGQRKNFEGRLDCAGRFTLVPNEEQYTQALYNIFHLSEETARVVVNVHDRSHHLYETTIPISLYDSRTGLPKHTVLYTIDGRFAPDTLSVDPLVSYDVEFGTRPPVRLTAQQFRPMRTNKLSVAIEQGTLRVRPETVRSSLPVATYPVVVRRHGDAAILHTQQTDEEATYLAGEYDVDVLSLPPIHMEGVQIENSAATELTIPAAGCLNLIKPREGASGLIMSIDEGRTSRVCDLNESRSSERISLMPGEYLILLRMKNATRYDAVRQQRVKIESGQQTNVSF